jgi:hypothetical protein
LISVRSKVQIFPGPPALGVRYFRHRQEDIGTSGWGPRVSTVFDLRPPHPRLTSGSCRLDGAIAQLGERLLCKQEVVGSIPSGSTSLAPPDCEMRPRSKRTGFRCHRGSGLLDIVKKGYAQDAGPDVRVVAGHRTSAAVASPPAQSWCRVIRAR